MAKKRQAEAAEAPRRGSRKRRTVAEAKAAEEGPQENKPKEKPDYKPKKGGEKVAAVTDYSEGKRDKRGRLIFDGFPEFRPTLTPKQVIRAGSFGGIYFRPDGGRKGMKGDRVDIDPKEFPSEWFEGLPEHMYYSKKYNISTNKYGVKAGQNQTFWEEKGWIREQDPRGWFHWYCRFYLGRRTEDDKRQISRWKGTVGDKGRFKRALVNKIVRANKSFDDPSVSPVQRQSLLHWAYELTKEDFDYLRSL